MITPHTLRLEDRTGSRPPLYMAPYDEAEIAYIMPIDPPPLESMAMQAFYRQSPTEQVDAAWSSNNVLSWGIYTGAVNTEAFIGTLDLMRDADDTQEIGTFIVQSQRKRGYGTLAKLAVATFAMAHHGTHTFTAQTAMANLPAQHSLARAGFGFLKADVARVWACGGMTYHWQLTRPDHVPDGLEPYQRLNLIQGWLRYQQAMKTHGLAFVKIGSEADDEQSY